MSIDLGKELPKVSCPSSEGDRRKVERFYPSVYLEDVKNLPTIPEAGTMTVRFKRRTIQATKREDGTNSVTVTIDLVSIEKIGSEKSARQNSVDAFDAVAKEVFEESED